MAVALLAVAITVFKGVVTFSVQDEELEENYTQSLVVTLRTLHPDKNVMVCHVPHAQNFVNSTHTHYELPLFLGGRTQGYDIYIFDSGVFSREGDGGFSNWCFAGKFKRGAGRFESNLTFSPIHRNDPPLPGPPKIQSPPPTPIRSHPDGVYFVNCQRGNEISSGLAYYKFLGGNDGKQPDAYVDVSHGSFIDWEGSGQAEFKDGNRVHWDIFGTAQEKKEFSYCGSADNNFHSWSIYKDRRRVLYEVDGWQCTAIYWCF